MNEYNFTTSPDRVNNTTFLKTVFRDLPEGASPVVTGFRRDPTEAAKSSWAAKPANGNLPSCIRSGHNNYFAIASVKPHNGRLIRKAEHAAAVHCVLIDDVGPKGKVAAEDIKLPPSWELETSPGNFQYGYLLTEPAQPKEAEPVVKALAHNSA